MFQKQPAARKLFYPLILLFIFAVFFYGVKFLLTSVLCFIAGVICQYILNKRSASNAGIKIHVPESVFLACMLYTLSLPPAIPLWIALIGIIFGILFCALALGEFGKNPINQALISRVFIYIVFYKKMTSSWVAPSIFGIKTIDSVSSATPLAMMRDGILPDPMQLFCGLKAGAAGEGFVIIIIIAAIYLFCSKAVSWKATLSAITVFVVVTGILFYADFINAFPPVYGVMSGSVLFAFVFMLKDPLAEHKIFFYPWLYGIFIGITVALIRTFTPLAEGTTIAILSGNILIFLTEKVTKKNI